jgi:deoxyhypusine synthase
MRKNQILSAPTRPLAVDGRKSVAALLEKMQGISFQGRALATAYQIWKKMLGDRVMIMMGMSGAMVPAGMRRLVVYMLENRIHETLGRFHYQSSPFIDDLLLQENLIDRIYDALADEEEFREADEMIGRFAASLDPSRAYSTREFLYLLGQQLAKKAKEDGIVTAAAKARVPLHCPAIGDSFIGIGIAENRFLGQNQFTFDVIGDMLETAHLAADSPASGVIYFGGGTPKNFVNQTEVTATFMRQSHNGHKYAVQIVTDAAHWGTFPAARSKNRRAGERSRATLAWWTSTAIPPSPCRCWSRHFRRIGA